MLQPRMRFFNIPNRLLHSIAFAMVLSLLWQSAHAGPIRDRIMEHQTQGIEKGDASGAVWLPPGVRLMRDVPYGNDGDQRMDVYLPRQAAGAPVIFMVHGGAWRLGDKGARSVVENKVAHWVTKGFVFISANYRMLPKAAPVEQAQDIALALATAQGKAAAWGADPAKFIVMGHSAGAHLVALLAASPAGAFKLGARPWLVTVLLDSAALDVVALMEARHARLYDQAFGSDPAYWKAASPFHALSDGATPLLAVCSTRRGDSCPQASRFVAKAQAVHARAGVLEQDLSHMDINQQLGLAGGYTDAVDSFMGALDESVMRALANPSSGTR